MISQFLRLVPVCLTMIILMQACSDRALPPDAQTPTVIDSLVQGIDPLLEGLDLTGEPFAAPQPPRWPDDLSTHPAMRSESFALQAIVYPATEQMLAGDSEMAALMLRVDRVGLTAQSSEDKAVSAWQYNGVMRTAVAVDAANAKGATDADVTRRTEAVGRDETMGQSLNTLQMLATMQPRQSVQRMALGLAGSDDNTLWVGNDRLSMKLAATASHPCQRRYRWVASASGDARLLLDFSIKNCPQAQSIGLLSRWQSSGVSVSGFLLSGPDNARTQLTPIAGVAWFSQSWGNLPATGGAVAIDTLQLEFDNQQVLDVSRSKRRSGRGPQTVSATLRSPALPAKSLSMRWVDSTEQLASEAQRLFPQSIRLVSEDQSIDVRVSVMNQLTEADGLAGDRLQGAVVADGTHRGVGFVFYTALSASP